MKADIRDGDTLLRHPNGTPVFEDGRAVKTWECIVTFNGEPCECQMADEEQGVVAVILREERLRELSAWDLVTGPYEVIRGGEELIGLFPLVREYRTGEVKISVMERV